MIELTPLQQQGIDFINDDPSPIKRIAGVAGSGKTFVLAQVATEENDIVTTPTNKAAQVLRDRGIAARTVYSFMYETRVGVERDKDGKPIEDAFGRRKEKLEFKHRLDFEDTDPEDYADIRLFIDESSMVGGKLFADVKRFVNECGTHVVMFGDPFQLPPVKDEDVFKAAAPNVFFDEVHRTAADNPVLAFASHIRTHSNIYGWEGLRNESPFPIVRKTAANAGSLIFRPETQVVCWKNVTRRRINEGFRKMLGREGLYPVEGDKIIFTSRDRKGKVFNGLFAVVEGVDVGPTELRLDVETENGVRVSNIEVSKHPFLDYTDWGPTKRRAEAGMFKSHQTTCDFAYAITAHKSQGSEWPDVTVIDEISHISAIGLDERRRWVYTAITRTRENLSIVRG